MAATWLVFRDRIGLHAQQVSDDAVRQQLRLLRRGLEDTFEAVEAVMRILEESRTRAALPTFLSERTRFGSGVMLIGEELAKAQQFLSQLDMSAVQARQAARNLLFMMQSANMAETAQIVFNPDSFNEQLNSILLDSSNLGDAMTKLRIAQREAEDFVIEIERALRRN
jgi:hypothetical protein